MIWCSFTQDRGGSPLPRSAGSEAWWHARITDTFHRIAASEGHVVSPRNPADVTSRSRPRRLRRRLLDAEHFRYREQRRRQVRSGCRKRGRVCQVGLRRRRQVYVLNCSLDPSCWVRLSVAVRSIAWKKLISKMTYYVSSGTLHSAHSLTPIMFAEYFPIPAIHLRLRKFNNTDDFTQCVVSALPGR